MSAALPLNFTVCTYNIWNEERWPERKEPLESFVRRHTPDILCLQELRKSTRNALDAALPGHARIDDPFAGWTIEGNIYWNTQLFALIEYGAADIGIVEAERRLFWARLRLLDGTDRTLFVGTAHYTWMGHPQELATQQNQRVPQAAKTVEVLARLVPDGAPLLFMGDLNDFAVPIEILRVGGLTDAFGGLGRDSRPTHPATPIVSGAPVAIDWIFYRGAIRPKSAEVVDFYHNGLPASDHKPVLATFVI